MEENWKYGDDVNTDFILPGIYLELTDPDELGKHAMEGLDTEFNGVYPVLPQQCNRFPVDIVRTRGKTDRLNLTMIKEGDNGFQQLLLS